MLGAVALRGSAARRHGLAPTVALAAPPLCPVQSMEDLPLYGVGISAGSAFLLKMPRYMKVGGCAQMGAPCTWVLPAAAAASAWAAKPSSQRAGLAWRGQPCWHGFLPSMPSWRPALGPCLDDSFDCRPSRPLQFDGLVSEALGIDPKSGGFDVVLGSEC